MTNNIQAVLRLIRRHQKFLITTHLNPDADAICSALAMALFLRSLGKKVWVLNEDEVASWLKFLPQTKLFQKACDLKDFDYDAAIILDCGDLKRIGNVAKFLNKDKPIINIDHHITNDKFGNVNFVQRASSTCEILFCLLKAAKHRLNKDLAVLLYAGLMTDTGSFRYDNTTALTHAMTAELMHFGISAPDLYNRLYVGIPVRDIKLFTHLIHKADLLLDKRVYCLTLPKKIVNRFSKDFDLKEKIFLFLRSVEGVEVVVILTEVTSKEVRLNFRSQNAFDVSKLAQQFNGGGHVKAAGGKIYDTLAIAKKQVIAAIKKQIPG